MIDLDELERLCREATPGKWWHCTDGAVSMKNQTHFLRSEADKLVSYGHLSQDDARLIAALRNAAPELIAMARRYQWLPIETAPDDMTESVVVRWTNSDGEECREFDHREEGIWVGWHEYAENVEIIGGHGVSYEPLYTHWMPLPDAPQEQKR